MGSSVAIIGASADPSKFGNKAVRAFLRRGWKVYPVSPRGGEIEGLPVYQTLEDVPGPVDCVSMYVPPQVGIGLLESIAARSPAEFYLNPGSADSELVARARAIGLDPIEACSIVAIGEIP